MRKIGAIKDLEESILSTKSNYTFLELPVDTCLFPDSTVKKLEGNLHHVKIIVDIPGQLIFT